MVNIELTAEVLLYSVAATFAGEESYMEGIHLPPVFWKGKTSPLRGTEQCSGVKIPDAPKLGREEKSEIL